MSHVVCNTVNIYMSTVEKLAVYRRDFLCFWSNFSLVTTICLSSLCIASQPTSAETPAADLPDAIIAKAKAAVLNEEVKA